MTLFDCLKDIITTKSGTLHTQEGFSKAWSNYMIIRYLSMDRRFKDIAVEMNKYSATLTSEQLYLFLVQMVPKSSKSFIKYIKPIKTAKK
jgi:hypothetical protein